MSIEQIYDDLTDLKRSATFHAAKLKKLEMEVSHKRGDISTKEKMIPVHRRALAMKMKQILGYLKSHEHELNKASGEV